MSGWMVKEEEVYAVYVEMRKRKKGRFKSCFSVWREEEDQNVFFLGVVVNKGEDQYMQKNVQDV